jgi:hypothetical protein
MQFIETTKKITLDAAGGTSPTQRVWLAPVGEPFRDINISVNSLGAVVVAPGVDWDVLYGGVWDGAPYESTSTHSGGISQANGTFSAAEVATVIHTDTDIFPSNLRVVSPNSDGTITQRGFGGFPIVLELDNTSAVEVTLWVSIVARTVSIP